MNELRDHFEMARTYDSSGENQSNEDQSRQSSVELTPPGTSSVGELTPTSEDSSNGSSDSIGYQGENDDSTSERTVSSMKLSSVIEGVVSSHMRTTSPLVAWESVQAIAKHNIARIGQNRSSRGLESAWNNRNACLRQGDVRLSGQGISLHPHETVGIVRQDVGLNLRQDGHPTIGRDLVGNSLDISLRISTGDPSQTPLSPKTSRIKKKRGGPVRRHLLSGDGNSDLPSPRRGRPSERGFSCSRCAITKKRCIGNDDCCEACSKSPIYRQLCVRADFKDSRVLLHDLYKTRICTLLNNIVKYTSRSPGLEPIKITLSNGFDAQLDIELQHYVALNEDALTHTIFRGLEAGMIYPTARSTPFALQDGTLTPEKIDRYCERMACDMVLRESKNSARNSLLNHVMAFAATQINHEDARARVDGLDMVRLALRFWAIQSIFFTYPWRIEKGGHLVGMSPLQLPGYWNGITLLPRLLNQELDRAFETRMDQIEKEILEKLQAAIFKRHRDYWCSIFLSSFILLHSLERDTWNMSAWDYETRGRGPAAWPLRRSPSEYCAQNKHIADIIATHFKIVNQGSSPLKQNWNKRLNQQLLSDSLPARRFILSIQSDFNSPTSRKLITQSRRSCVSKRGSQWLRLQGGFIPAQRFRSW
ncbi:hypothetical protein GGS24DRAFT_402699 [Hypoxylon argillaceum]|nr:hypothetical protein GGS24DRAFT_402699 [Hypoxylon argillaceum]